jgi:hypothetical protein
MQLHKIISGGQTGADRAGLDAAIHLGIDHGGYCPRGRLAEDGRVPDRYQLTELKSSDYSTRTRVNIGVADATLIIITDRIGPGTRLTVKTCRELGRPYKIVSVRPGRDFSVAVAEVQEWLSVVSPGVLNVAGTRESSAPGIQDVGARFLVSVLTTGTVASEIFTILQEECGVNWLQRQDIEPLDEVTVVRLYTGTLGFGGKFYNHGDPWFVSCYPEDRTSERTKQIRRANERLTELWARRV